jgi:hypothetical protein
MYLAVVLWHNLKKTEHPEYVKKYHEIQQRRFDTVLTSEVDEIDF